jgi:NifU-like protein involved in Fe-S cluster formation
MKSTSYSDKVLDHFRNPRNVGEIEMIDDIKFKTFGCGSAVSTSSMVTEMAKGMTLDEAYKITRKDVAEELDGLPPIKMHCSNLAADALKAAIDNYRTGAEPDVEIATSCQLDTRLIIGVEKFVGKGVYKEIPANLEEFKDKRTLVLDSGDASLELALKLTKVTGRVIVVTSAKSTPGSVELRKELNHSEVKILYQSDILEVMGQMDEVEKVLIHDYDEDENYELRVDAVILIDYRG